MSNLAFALAGALLDKDRQAQFKADYERGLNLAVNAAEPAPLPPDAMPITTPDAYSKFPVGSPVRDFLSGIEGVVATPPEGEFGDIVFITDEDGKTYAVRFDQVRAIEPAPGAGAPMPPPMPEAPPVPGAEAGLPAAVPAMEPASLKASTEKYREHLRAKNALLRAAASVNDESLVVAAADDRKLTFKQLKAHLNAIEAPTAKETLAFIGYVPSNFDAIWAALVRDGVKVTASNAMFHVEQMVAKGMTASEIKFTVCSSNGGVLGKLIAGMPPTAKPTEPAPAGMTYVWDSKIGEWTTVAASLAPKAEGKDTLGKPVEVSHTDNKSGASGAPSYPVEHNKDEGKTGGGKDTEGQPVKVATEDGKSPASGAPSYPVLDPDKAGGNKVAGEDKTKETSVGDPVKVKSEDHQPTPPKINPSTIQSAAEVDTIGAPLKVKTEDHQTPASGAPNYPVADPAKGGAAPRDQSAEDTLGKTLEVKTFDNQAPASGAPNYPVMDPEKAGGQAAPGAPAVHQAPAPAAPAPALTDQKPPMTPNAVPPKAETEPKPEPVPAKPKAETEPKEPKEGDEKPKPKGDEKPKPKDEEKK